MVYTGKEKEKTTTVAVRFETAERLHGMSEHSRETMDSVITRLLGMAARARETRPDGG